MRQRAHHLAKDLGISLKELVTRVDQDLNLLITSHSVLLRDEQVKEIRALFEEPDDRKSAVG